MLTNTVGIMLFILAFTVLTTGGVALAKRLPLMRKTEAKAVHFLCLSNQVIPVNLGLGEKLPEPFGRLDLSSARAFLKKFNEAQVEDDYAVTM